MRRALLLLAALVACKGDPPQKPPPPAPPAYRPNQGSDVLASSGGAADGVKAPAGDWVGRWHGEEELLSGDLRGRLSRTLDIRKLPDGRLRLTESAVGITVVRDLVISPDDPNLAAGVSYDQRGVRDVTLHTRIEDAARLDGDHLTLGEVRTTTTEGTVNGMTVPAPAPQRGIDRLERVGSAR